MKAITKKQFLNLDEMTGYFIELIKLADVADIVFNEEETPLVSILLQSALAVNRSFIKALPLKEHLINKELIRLQIQNIVFLYAENKHPLKVIKPIFTKGKVFGKLGLPSLTSFIEELEPEFKGLKDLWNRCCSYVHPSENNLKLATADYTLGVLAGIDKNKQTKEVLKELKNYIAFLEIAQKEEIEDDVKNMFHLNLLLIKLTKQQIALQKAKAYQNEKTKNFYKKIMKDKAFSIRLEYPKHYLEKSQPTE